ncbi:PQQ-binding-like beta-propeller repeat protein [Planctomycetota bacterium]
MMKASPLFQRIFIGMVVIGTTCVVAQDWPQWRGPNRDGKGVQFNTPEQWPTELNQKWRVTVGFGDATPALVGDKLIVFARQGEEEVILGLNANTGQELWKESYPAVRPTGGPGRHPGPRSSCAVAQGKVIALGVGGTLSCLDAANGTLLWRKDPFPKIVPSFFTSVSPIVVDGMVITHLGGKGNGAIIAYDLATGDEKWRWAGEGPEYGSPVLLTVGGIQQIVTPTEQHIVGVGIADGKLLWQYPFPPQSRAYNSVTPIVDGETVIISGAKRGTRALKIVKQGDVFSANEVWNNPDIATQYNTPVLRDGLLFGLTESNKLFCLNAKTGKTTWTDTATRGSRSFGAIVSTDACLFLLTNASELIAFKPDGEAYSEIAHYSIAETQTIAHPVITGKRIYIKAEETLTLWTIE